MAAERGGVGLVFRKDDDDDRFLIVHKVTPGGPADASSSVSTGDRLIEIDGVSLGAASPDNAPQLPGVHGSRVQLCFQRGRIGQGAVRYSIYLVRDKDFFPDKLLTESALRKELSEKSRAPGSLTGGLPSSAASWSRPPTNYSPPPAPVESPAQGFGGAHSRDALEEALLSSLPRHQAPASSTNMHLGSIIPDPHPRFSLGSSSAAHRDEVVVEEDTPPPSLSKPPRPSLAGRVGTGDRKALDASGYSATGLDPRGERLAALEAEVVEMSLQLEAARAEVAVERKKGFDALVKQGEHLRKERETSEARLMVSLSESGHESDMLRAKNLELTAQLRKLERKRAELQREKDDLQEAFLEKTQGVERDTAAAHRLNVSRLKTDHARQLEEAKADAEHRMSVLKLEHEAALSEQKQKAHDQLVKTTNAMRALTEDLKDARAERDSLETELENLKHLPHRTADVHNMQVAAHELANAQSEVSHLRKEAQRLQLELEKAQEGETDAVQQRDRLARELVMARAGMALAESETAAPTLANGRRWNAPAQEPEPEVAAALSVAESREAERNAPMYSTPGGFRGGRKDHDLTHSFSTPAVQRISGLPRQTSPSKKLAPEDRAHPPADPSLDIMRMYLGEATPRPAREESPAPATGGGSVRVEIVKGRRIPTIGGGGGEVFFRARLGGREVEGKRAEAGADVEWGHTFEIRCPAEEREGEMVTLLLTATERGGGGGRLLGYVAVPLTRLRASGQESGWYVLRTSDDASLPGDDGGECEALLRLTIVEGSEEKQHGEGERVGVFGVEITKGRGIPTSVGEGCYIAVQVSGQQRRTAVAQTTRPQWAEKFTLAVSKANELCSLMLWNADSNSADPYIGHVAVPVDRVIGAGSEEGWYEVRDQSGDIIPAPGGSGVCQVLARFTHSPAPEGALGPVTGWLSRGQLRGYFVLDPYLCELSRYDAKEDASLGARAEWCASAVGCRVACPPALSPQDVNSFEVETREEKELTVLTADTAAEARLWTDAIRKASQEQAGDEVPVTNAKNAAKAKSPETPAVQLQAAIMRDQEEAAKRRKEFDEIEERETKERELRERERRERDKERREEREREQAKREEEREAREREIRIEMGKESLAILQKEKEEEERLAAQQLQERRLRESEAEERRMEEERIRQQKEVDARKEALRVLAQQRTQHASAPEAPAPPSAPAHTGDANPPPASRIVPAKPAAVVEAYILKGRNIPVGDDGSVGAPGTAPAVSTTTNTPPPSGAPIWNESFQFPITSPLDTLVTIMVWALSLDGKRANIGHIAVPVSRVAASTKEEGWYEVRKSDGQVQTGESGSKTALLVSLTYADVTNSQDGVSCWVAVLSSDASSWKRRFAVLDPYRQTMLLYRSDEDASAHRPAAQEFNLRACTSDSALATSRVATALQSIKDPPPPLPPNPPKCAIHLSTHFDSLTIVLPTEAERESWNSQCVSTGNPPGLKKMPPPPHSESSGNPARDIGEASGLEVEVSVEKGRNLPTQKGGSSGSLHCAVQVGSSQSATQTEEVPLGVAVKWNTPAFRLPAQSEADLIAVMLIAKVAGEPDVPIGHIAVPVSRVVSTQKEEGWYEIRTQAGQVVRSDDGSNKASLLIRFRIVK